CKSAPVPKGRLKQGPLHWSQISAVPSGLDGILDLLPNLERLGYFQPSLRDENQILVPLDMPRSDPDAARIFHGRLCRLRNACRTTLSGNCCLSQAATTSHEVTISVRRS